MAEATPQLEFSHEPCRLLRAKAMFIAAEAEGGAPLSRSGHYWCVHTQNCLGPDGQLASRTECKPGRGCYQPG